MLYCDILDVYCGILWYSASLLSHSQAAHRKQTLLVTALYKTWPRLTFLYTYFFCYYEIFLPVLQFHFPLTEDGGELDEQEIKTDEAKTENDAEAFSEVGMDTSPSVLLLHQVLSMEFSSDPLGHCTATL